MLGGVRYVGVLFASAALLLTGCSSSDDEPEAKPEASESPTGAPTPTEPPPPEPVDPCSLLTEEDFEAVGLTVDMDKRERGLIPDPHTTSCLVDGPGDDWGAFYGYSLVPNVSAREAVDVLGTDKPVRLDVGDQAAMARYHAYGDTAWHAWANDGRFAVLIELFAKPRPAAVEQLLGRMLEQVDPAMFDFPVDLPEDCAPPRSRQVRALLGEAFVATGSDFDGELRCSYATRRGLLLDLYDSPFANADRAQRTARQVEKYFEPEEMSTPARGVTLYVSADEYYAYSAAYVSRPPAGRGASLEQRTPIGDLTRSMDYDQQQFRTFAAWWATQG